MNDYSCTCSCGCENPIFKRIENEWIKNENRYNYCDK